MKTITTSWDDGHPLDFRIAELLDKYNLQGTFYIPQRNGPQAMLNELQIQQLATRFEIGGHTLNHTVLDNTDEVVLQNEVGGSHAWLQQVCGKAPVSFCFPKGVYTEAALKAVFRYGYKLARTTELLSTAIPPATHLLPTSLQAYQHTNVTYTKHLAKRGMWRRLATKMLTAPTTNLVKLTHHYLDKIEKDDGCFHLWGHSWEIEAFGLWTKLEELFKVLAARKAFAFVSNGQLLTIEDETTVQFSLTTSSVRKGLKA